MPAISFHKVNALPVSPEANAVYFVANGAFCDIYVIDAAGHAKGAGTTAMIDAVTGPQIAAALAAADTAQADADRAMAALPYDAPAVPLLYTSTGGYSRNIGASKFHPGCVYTVGSHATINGATVNGSFRRLFHDGAIDPSFACTLSPVTVSSYFHLERENGSFLVSSPEVTSVNGLALAALSGQTWPVADPETGCALWCMTDAGANDASFTPVIVKGWLGDIVELPDGKFLCAAAAYLEGSGAPYNGSLYINGVQRNAGLFLLNADGSLNTTMLPTSTSADATGWSQGASYITPLRDGRFAIYGWFDEFGGLPASGLGILNADMTRGMVPALTLGSMASAAEDHAPYIDDVQQLYDGKFLIAGYFGSINGHATQCVARLNADFTVDTTFAVAGIVETNYGGYPSINNAIGLDDGKVLIAGVLNTLDGQPFYGVARLLANGTPDTSYRFVGGGAPGAYTPTVYARVSRAGRCIYFTQFDFTSINGFAVNKGSVLRMDMRGNVLHGDTRLYTARDRADVAAKVPINEQGQVDPKWNARKTAAATAVSGVLTLDLSAAEDFYVALTGNITSSRFTNPPAAGYSREGVIVFKQDAAGSRTFAAPPGTRWAGGTAIALSTTANAEDHYRYRVDNRTGTPVITLHPTRDLR